MMQTTATELGAIITVAILLSQAFAVASCALLIYMFKGPEYHDDWISEIETDDELEESKLEQLMSKFQKEKESENE